MRSTRRNILKRSMAGAARMRVESRDAVLWSIDSDSSCRVKIQGSNELITAHFPRNQKARPSWMRVGNAVRITHRGGIRGYVEISGQGRAIPQPMLGSALPSPGSTADGIITGMVVSETVPLSNGVLISPGTYRINQTIYNYNGQLDGFPTMTAGSTLVMGVAPVPTLGDLAFALAAAPEIGYFRYDLVVIGADRVVDYITGTATTSNPPMPAVPANHILLQHILRVGGDTNIPNERIGAIWTVPRPTSASLAYSTPMPWSEYNDHTEMNITATVYDQYGYTIRAPSTGWPVRFVKYIGTGQLYSNYSGYDPDEVAASLINQYSTSFKYQRDQTVTEIQPRLMLEVGCQPPLYAFIFDLELAYLIA